MTTAPAERVFVDTNVLLAATDEARPDHAAADAVLRRWPADGVSLYVSGQVLREYVVVATRPIAVNGLGLDPSDVVANVRALRSALRMLEETTAVADSLLRLVEERGCRGKQVHDANLVAVMQAHGLDVLVTRNVADFRRFLPHVTAVDPLDRS
ncbi:type II toxin-antitoxin system VapC family toxin [Aquipuribacter nitratireducens]|uniref:Ribonuclease VapC n=1 Tax=Aquipuribacter nitratireducens TaxID=650104 RepID=A0ABW0GQJ4_9MICO